MNTQTLYGARLTVLVWPEDASTGDNMRLAEASGVLDFWREPEEDIYSETE